MTADIRTAARDEAFKNHYSHKQVPDRYDADLLINGFMDGAVWGAARVAPTREQVERALIGRDFIAGADAVLALMQELAEGERYA